MLGGCELAGRQDLHLPGADLSSGAVGSGTLACNSKLLEAASSGTWAFRDRVRCRDG